MGVLWSRERIVTFFAVHIRLVEQREDSCRIAVHIIMRHGRHRHIYPHSPWRLILGIYYKSEFLGKIAREFHLRINKKPNRRMRG